MNLIFLKDLSSKYEPVASFRFMACLEKPYNGAPEFFICFIRNSDLSDKSPIKDFRQGARFIATGRLVPGEVSGFIVEQMEFLVPKKEVRREIDSDSPSP